MLNPAGWIALCLMLAASAAGAGAPATFGWRGDGTGQFPDVNPPTEWSETKNVRWSAAVGSSYSSPILADKLVVVTSEPNWIVAVNRADGKIAWKVEVKPGDLPDAASRKPAAEYEPPKAGSGLAAATPLTDGTRIFALFANGILRAVDLNGKPLWSTYINAEQNTGYGRSASPILVAGKLIVHMTNLYAFDPATGKQLWANTKAPSGYGTPAGIKIGDAELIVTPDGRVVRAYDGKTVDEDIAHGGKTTPLFHDGIIYFGDNAVSAIKLNAAFKDEEIWSAMIPPTDIFGSPLLIDGMLFIVTGKGQLFAFSVNGKSEQQPLFKPRSLFPDAETDPVTFSSMTRAGKYIFLTSNQGDAVVLECSGEAKIVARNKLPEGSAASPVFAGKHLYLRSGERLFCISAP